MGAANVDQNQLEQIGNYVKENIGHWLREQNIFPFPPQERGLDKELLERMIRVEESLKYQGEKLEQMMIQSDKRFESVDKRFEEMQHNMDKRFEAVDKRFEDMDKRFSQLTWFMGTGFVMLCLLISLFQFLHK